jgi:non-canonical poly(A) RNA polymerase PAPD5/7
MEDLTRKLRMTQLARDIDIFDQTTLPEEEDEPDRRATKRHIKSLVRRELHGDAKVQVFGSSRVGTDLPTSDVDIAVNHDIIWKRWLDQGGDRNAPQDVVNEVIKPDMIHAARKVAAAIRRDPKFGNTVAITRCRVPLVRTSCEINELRTGIDIVFGQKNGIAAAKWTQHMIESVHPELRPLTKSVKALLKQKGLGDVSRGGLGSHAVTCALVCYLNHVKRQMKDGKEGKRGEKDGKRGEKEEKEDGELDAEVGTVDLGEAFVGFLREMGKIDVEKEVLTLERWRAPKPSAWMTEDEFARSGRPRTSAPDGGFTVRDPPRLGIEDPADGNRNLCAGSHDVRRVLEGFRGAVYNNGPKSYLTRFFNVEDALLGRDDDYGLSSKRERSHGGERAEDRPGKIAKMEGTRFPPPDI